MSGATIDYDSPLSIGLRGGGDVLIWPDRVSSGSETYPLAELTRAAVVSTPVSVDVVVLGEGLTQALLLQLRDGRAPLFVPSDPSDASRALAAILRLQPDLELEDTTGRSATNLKHLPAQPPTSQGWWRSSTGRQTGRWGDIAPTDRVLAGLAHLSVFYMPLLLPFILWLALRRGSPYASRQAKQAFVFHLLILAVVSVVILPAWVVLVLGGLDLATTPESGGIHAGGATLSISSIVCGGALMIALAVALSIYSMYGAVQAFMGKPFHYLLLQRL